MTIDPKASESVAALLGMIPTADITNHSERASQAEYEANLNASNGVEGWTQQIIPWTTEAAWNAFLDIVNTDEIKMVALVRKETGEVTFRQGSVLISPKGMANLAQSNKRKK